MRVRARVRARWISPLPILSLPYPSSFTILICIILPTLCARDLGDKVQLHNSLFLSAFLRFSLDSNLDPVSVVVSKSRVAMVKQNPLWPVPRYTKMPQNPMGSAFVCLARHKITDVTSLVCNLSFLIFQSFLVSYHESYLTLKYIRF